MVRKLWSFFCRLDNILEHERWPYRTMNFQLILELLGVVRSCDLIVNSWIRKEDCKIGRGNTLSTGKNQFKSICIALVDIFCSRKKEISQFSCAQFEISFQFFLSIRKKLYFFVCCLQFFPSHILGSFFQIASEEFVEALKRKYNEVIKLFNFWIRIYHSQWSLYKIVFIANKMSSNVPCCG